MTTWRVLDFPGYFAGASLKPIDRSGPVYVPARDFPGYFAGASLKPRDGVLARRLRRRLPRLLRRGLIEATAISISSRRVPVGLPRLLRRGLIEAV